MKKVIKLCVNCGVFAKTLANVIKIINFKNTMPILADVVLQKGGSDNEYFLIGSDGEHWVRQRIHMDTINDGLRSIALHYVSKLQQAAKETNPDKTVILEIDTDNMILHVSYTTSSRYEGKEGEGSFSIPVVDATDYPMAPAIKTDEEHCQLSIGTKFLLPAVKAASSCIGGDSIRIQLDCVCMDISQEGMTVVGSDGHKLYKKVYNVGVGGAEPFMTGTPMNMLLHRKAISAFLQATADCETVFMESDRHFVRFVGYGTKEEGAESAPVVVEIYAIQPQAKYPNYNAVIPKNTDKVVTVCVRDLQKALKRVMLFSSESTNLVEMSYNNGSLVIATEDIDYARRAKETVAVVGEEKCPDGFKIGIKGVSLYSLLPNVNTENVCLHFRDERSAVVLKDEDVQSTQVMMTMPMLLENQG